MNRCPQCKAEIASGLMRCSSCGLDLSSELEATKLSDDGKGREPTEILPRSNQTEPSGPFASGTVLAGRYRLITPIGKGGMGEVYKADDLELDQAVALKFLPATIAKDEAALKRFRSEVRTARQVAHPNVCRVFDIAEDEGVYFITMEFIEGDDLSMLLRRIGRLPSDKAVEIARQLCLGLHAIHDAGILHRDLKPANIIIDQKGKARITDFGIAGVEAELTRDDFRSGTPAYMSPEQFDGKSVTQKSDIYSLGLLLYEIFTGKQAIQFESLPELIHKHQSTTPTNPSEILKDIDPIVEKTILQCLEKHPDDRPANALQVALMLPGGNPLEAAIAAGETPSPEMVAAAPKKGALGIWAAGPVLAGIILLLIGFAFTEYNYWIVPTNERSSEVLAVRAREIADKLGYKEQRGDAKYKLWLDRSFHLYAWETKDAVKDPGEMLRAGQPAVRYFLYRQSPLPITSIRDTQVTPSDPPMTEIGMVNISTDMTGRLIRLEAVPPRRLEAADEKKAVDWSVLFQEAGLDQDKYKPVAPSLAPSFFADEQAAWEGPFISDPDISVRIEAAGFDGKPIFFQIVAPWTSDPRTEREGRRPPIALELLWTFLVGALLIGVIALSWHNFRAGRGDLKGSVRVMLFFLVIGIVTGLILADHVADTLDELALLGYLLMRSVFLAVLAGLLYSSLEPQIRRMWPELLISWSRLVGGDLRNPMVGRDILSGAFFGLLFYFITHLLLVLLPGSFDRGNVPPIHFYWYDTVPRAVADIIGFAIPSLLFSFGFLFVIFFGVFIFRRRWGGVAFIAIILTILTIASHTVARPSIFVMAISTLGWVLPLISVFRFGVLGLAAFCYFFYAMTARPLTPDSSSIYFSVSIAGFVILLSIALYAFYISTGGRSFSLAKMLDGTGDRST